MIEPGNYADCGHSRALAHAVPLRQSYVRVGPRLLFKNNRYGYARQTRRMQRTTAKLKTVLGRVYRDLERKLVNEPEAVQAAFSEEMALAKRLLAQQRQDKHKLYALHAPLVVGAQSLAGNPHDSRRLKEALREDSWRRMRRCPAGCSIGIQGSGSPTIQMD